MQLPYYHYVTPQVESSAAAMVGQLEDLEMDELPMVKIGDASVAAPFTSKMPSIRSCVDIVRQGRCTLVTSIQMYQILALNCLISAYSLSVLYLDGVSNSLSMRPCLTSCRHYYFVLNENLILNTFCYEQPNTPGQIRRHSNDRHGNVGHSLLHECLPCQTPREALECQAINLHLPPVPIY